MKQIKYIKNFKIPQDIKNDMAEFVSACISSIPEYNITETVSEWAERCRTIGKGLTANPGPFSYDITPYLLEIVNNLSDSSPVAESYVMKGTQIGYNVGISENHIGYCIEYGIGPGIFVGGDQHMAEEEMSLRVDEMISGSGLQGKVKTNVSKIKGKSTGDTRSKKEFGGTFMRAVGPNSESKARSFPARWVHFDEMSSYPIVHTKDGKPAGDIVEKVIRRQDTYGPLRKTLGGSTPHLEGSSRIDELCAIGDERYYNVECPKCGKLQPLVWEHFDWERGEDGKILIEYEKINDVEIPKNDPVFYECVNPDCKYHMTDDMKEELLRPVERGGKAKWVPTKKPDRPFVRSYHIPGWYGMRLWREIVLEYIEKKDDPFKYPDFVNNVMAETWKESDRKPEDHELLKLAQEYEQWPIGFIKRDVLLLTIACDVQKNRLEAGIIGWGRDRQGYMIDYWTFEGNPAEVENSCWKRLAEKINAKYLREDGQELSVMTVFIDSQYLSDTVDMFCDGFPYYSGSIAGVFPVQSRDSQDKLVKQSKSNIKTPVITMHDQELKRGLYNILRKRPQSVGHYPSFYLHFSNEYGEEIYKQLTSEEIVPYRVNGVEKGVKILNTKRKRNEVLDIVKMNMGALQYAMDQYFKLLNDSLKLQKRPEVQEDVSIFFDAVEAMFYDEV